MILRNFLLVVNDVEVSKAFYRDLFGLQVVTDFGSNVILSGGLVLQEKKTWEELIGKKIAMGDGNAELYFEEADIEAFVEKLEKSSYPIKIVHPLVKEVYGKKVLRIYDPDGHMIEVGTPSYLWSE